LKKKFIDFSQLGKISAKNFNDFLVERDSLIFEDSMRDKSIQARIKVQRAILWITINRGFFAQLLSNLNIYGSSKIDPPTMCTNGFNIVYHPDFVLKQSDAAIRFVLCHEVLHCVGDHMSRRGNRNPLLWNYAADYAINPILIK
jgi:predicted metal-dependent peptidase